MQFDQPLGQRQAQPDPVILAVKLRIDLPEGGEGGRDLVRWNANSGIGHLDYQPAARGLAG